MKNAAIAKIFRKIGFIIEMNGNDVNATFKARAYKRTSDVIASLPTNIEEIYRKERLEGLQKIPSIGKAIALKIEEYITTGTIKYYEELKATTPLNIDDFYDLGDIDYVVVSDSPQKVMDYFVEMPEVDEVLGKGPSKTFVHLNNGMDADLFVVPEESFGSSLQYFTGSKEHGIATRKIALAKGLHLNEWGIFDNDKKRVAGVTEEEVYQALDLDWIPPEMRENTGEIEIAKKRGSLPSLIKYDDLKGDLQVHSNNTDGTMSIEEMALNARDKFGLSYIAISDHTKSLRLANGLDEKQLLDQANTIAELNDKINMNNNNKHFRILSSAEVNILKDGSLDISNNVLDKLDIVGAAIHSHFSLPIESQTARLISAAQNPSIDIIFHPTGRIINRREGYPVNISNLIEVANESNTILEIDAHYDRLDLKDEFIRMAVENNVKLVIDSDAHHPLHYAFLIFGIGQARRGWANKSDILNTLSAKGLLDSLK